MPYDEFKKRIDTARNILVGAVPSPAGQIDQITYALMYKFMNDIDDQSAALPGGKRTYFTGDYEKYNWHNLMSPSLGAHDRLELYRQAVQGMAKNENLPPLFREIYQNAFLPFNSSHVLTLFLKEIDKFSHGESDDIGDAYEYLLSITGSQGDVGQFRTPRHIIKFIVEAVNPTKDDNVLDPAVGTAGFLIAAYKHVMGQHDGKDESGKLNNETSLNSDERDKLHKNYRGFDIDPTMVRTASVNMYLHGFSTPDIINHDSLSSEEYWNDKYDVILANPPFMTPKGGIQPHKKFTVAANRAEVLFVDYIASHLKPNGRAGIVVPEGIIFQSGNAYKQLRKNLVESYLYAVISLPSGIFMPYSGVKTSILLLDKDISQKSKDILFIDIKNVGVSLGATSRKIHGDELPKALEEINKFKLIGNCENGAYDTIPKKLILENSITSLQIGQYLQCKTSSVGLKMTSLVNVSDLSKGKSSSTKTPPGEYDLFLTAKESKTSKHYDFDTSGVAVPLISALGHGKAAIKRIHRVEGKFALANLLCLIEPHREYLDSGYLYYVLDAAKDKMALLMNGAANVSMNIKDVENFKIPLPPIEIQHQIVAELDSYQKIIDAAQLIIKSYKPTIKVNPEWSLVKFGEKTLFDIQSGGTPSSGESGYWNGDVNWATLVDLPASNFITEIKSTNRKITKEGLSKSSAKLLPVGTILVSSRATIGRVAIARSEISTNQGFKNIIIKDLEKAIPEFIAYQAALLKERMQNLASGGTFSEISKTSFETIEVALPSIEIQRRIVAELEAEQQLINSNKKLIEIYQQKIKDKIAEVWGE